MLRHIFHVAKGAYIFLESLLLICPPLVVLFMWFKGKMAKYTQNKCVYVAFLAFAFVFTMCVLLAFEMAVMFVSYLTISYVFELFNLALNAKQSVSLYGFLLWPIDKLEAINANDALAIQVISLVAMYMLKERLKLHGLFGRLIIKHSYSIRTILSVSISGTVLVKLVGPLMNNFSESKLPVQVYNCLSHTGQTWVIEKLEKC